MEGEIYLLENSKINFNAVNKSFSERIGKRFHYFTDSEDFLDAVKEVKHCVLIIDILTPDLEEVFELIPFKKNKVILLVNNDQDLQPDRKHKFQVIKKSPSLIEQVLKLLMEVQPA